MDVASRNGRDNTGGELFKNWASRPLYLDTVGAVLESAMS